MKEINTVKTSSIDTRPVNIGSIRIDGIVEISNENTIIKAKNKFTQSMLKHITNFISYGNASGSSLFLYLPCYSMNMYVGSDLITTTKYDTAVLTSPIPATPTPTPPDMISGSTDNSLTGIFKLVITATWDPGTISGIVGEMALYLDTYDTLQGFGWGDNSLDIRPTNNRLVSRLSVADGDFSSFSINIWNPLVITWTIQLSFQ